MTDSNDDVVNNQPDPSDDLDSKSESERSSSERENSAKEETSAVSPRGSDSADTSTETNSKEDLDSEDTHDVADDAVAKSSSGDEDSPQDNEGAGHATSAASSDDGGGDDGSGDSGPPWWQRFRWVRGGVPLLVGGFTEFVLTSVQQQFTWGVPVGTLAVLVATWGLLDLLGTFDGPDDQVVSSVSFREVARPLGVTVGMLALTLVLIGLAVQGYLPIIASAVLIPASFLGLVAAVYRTGETLGPWKHDETGQPRPLLQRHGFWVVVTGTLLSLPMLGSYSLSDPWETHYGEVAREILARNDWISTWWAQDGWFWSKPVLNFWTEALSMSLFHVHYQPDQMLGATLAQGRIPWPEWAVRMPVFIFSILGLYLIYKGVAKIFGRRPAMLGAMVLATMPHWFLIAHQTMTDLPFVAAMTAAMGLLLAGLHTDPDKKASLFELRVGKASYRISGFHLVMGVIIAVVLPQVLYLVSRNVALQLPPDAFGFRPHLDVFYSGSGLGNCGLPGNQACRRTTPANPVLQPWMQGVIWSAVLGALYWLNRKERRVSRLLFLGAWFFAAVSTMGKGPAGFVLPGLCAGAYVFATARWKKMTEVEYISGALIILAVAIPWYFAMFIRHGQPFTDRLLFHDMWKRAMVHVHDTNSGIDVSFRYYIWQLGYALFPWTGLVPVGLTWWLRRREDARGSGHGDASVFLAMWFTFAFALFTAMLTKFHHYIFPAVPPVAMLVGILIDRLLGRGEVAKSGKLVTYLVGIGAGAGLVVYGVFRMFPGMLMGYKPIGAPARPGNWQLALPIMIAGVALLAFVIKSFGAPEDTNPEGMSARDRQRRWFEDVLLGVSGFSAAMLVAAIGFDLAGKPSSGPPGQESLLFLFTYNYRRAWPDSLEFSGMIAAFAIVTVGIMLLLVVRQFRHHVTVIAMAVAMLWAAWGLDIYLVKTAPHWGQRETIMAYYQHRKSPEEPLVAYQMNWKGENFYTSNHIPAFVSSGAKFKRWIKQQAKDGTRVMYFVTEHSRSRSLKSELSANLVKFEKVTSVELDNKFGIFRATLKP